MSGNPSPPPAAPPAPPAAPPAPPPTSRFGLPRAALAGLDPRGWRGTLALGAALIVLTVGTQAINAAIPVPTGPVDPGTEGGGIPVSTRVAIHPASGWTVGGRLESPDGIRFEHGDVVLDVRTTTWTTGGPGPFLSDYLKKTVEPDTTSFDLTSVDETVVANQYPAVLATYVGTFKGVASPLEGRVIGIVFKDGLAIVFDAWAPEGSLSADLDDLKDMLDTVEVGS